MAATSSLAASRASLMPVLALGALSVVWGTQYLVIKHGQATVPPLLTVALRFAIVAVASQALAMATGQRAPRGSLAARLGFGVAQAISMGTLYWAEGHIPSALAAILVGTEPLFVALLAPRLVPGDPLGLRTGSALVFGFAGIVFVALAQGRASEPARLELLAVLAVLVGCVAGALNKVLGKRMTSRVPPAIAMRDMGLTVALVIGALSFATERARPVVFSWPAIAAILYLGLVASTAASTLYYVLLRRFPVTAMAYLQFVIVMVAVGSSVGLGHERLARGIGVGLVAILGGLTLLARPSELRT